MLRLIIILILTFGLHYVGFGQTLTGQVFMLTENFVEDKCEVIADCDCCSTDLFFLSSNEFGMIDRCLFNDSYYRGTYYIKQNKLILNFKQLVVTEITDEDTDNLRNERKAWEIEPYQFTINQCNKKVRLQHDTIDDFKNGSRYSLTGEQELFQQLKESAAWKLVSQ